ncbi:MAG: 50S ribosomal protein L15 [Planctomycetota bacterium]
MDLSDLNGVPMRHSKRKRVGRGPGSGQGKTAGRGTKGQKSRSGYSRRIGFEGGQMPLYRRLPKKGFTNALFKVTYSIINTGQLEDFECESGKVDMAVLKEAGLIKKNSTRLKILGKGALSRNVEVEAHAFSSSAKQMIEDAGGTAREISAK